MKYRITVLLSLLIGLRLSGQMNNPSNNSNAQGNFVATESILFDPSLVQLSDDLVSEQNSKAEQYWKNMLRYEKTNAEYWLNYYKSIRFRSQSSGQETALRPRLDSITTEMKTQVAGTWQQLFVYYWNGNHDLSRTASIEQAYQLQPRDGDLLRQLIANKLISGEKLKAAKYAAEWQATGQASIAYFNYAYNVLQSVAQNCVLITNGEFDTYPVLMQQNKSIRTDVGILNLALVKKSANRARLFRNLGLKLPNNDSVSDFNAEYIRRIAAANPDKKIYLAATVSGKMLTDLQNELYVTGLAFRFSSTEPVDNLVFLRDNIGSKMNASYYAAAAFDSPQITRLKMNYVLPLAVAARQYEIAGNSTKAEALRSAARKIGTANGKLDEVNTIIGNQ